MDFSPDVDYLDMDVIWESLYVYEVKSYGIWSEVVR